MAFGVVRGSITSVVTGPRSLFFLCFVICVFDKAAVMHVWSGIFLDFGEWELIFEEDFESQRKQKCVCM